MSLFVALWFLSMCICSIVLFGLMTTRLNKYYTTTTTTTATTTTQMHTHENVTFTLRLWLVYNFAQYTLVVPSVLSIEQIKYPVYPVVYTFWTKPERESDAEEWPDIRPTGTGYPAHPYSPYLEPAWRCNFPRDVVTRHLYHGPYESRHKDKTSDVTRRERRI